MKNLQYPHINPTQPFSFPFDQKNLPKYLAKNQSINEIKIVYFGTPEFSAYILEKLIEFCDGVIEGLPKLYHIQAVITRADKPVGRKQLMNQSPAAIVAHKYQIPILKPKKLDEDFINSHLSLLTCDLFIVASYGKIIPQNLLDIPKLGSLNVHPSLLPKYRGASPIQAAILNGEKKTGITIMLMDAEMDHGPILSTKEISLSEQETYQTLSTKMSQAGSDLLLETIVRFLEGKITPQSQNHTKATFTKLIKKEDGYFDISNPPTPEILDRMIRAYYPWPGVWTKWNNKIIKFYPGNLIQMEGKKIMSKKDFLNGYPDFPLFNQ